ncbi:hypothetical protein ACQ4PT_011944 [Festuca glaucescens]
MPARAVIVYLANMAGSEIRATVPGHASLVLPSPSLRPNRQQVQVIEEAEEQIDLVGDKTESEQQLGPRQLLPKLLTLLNVIASIIAVDLLHPSRPGRDISRKINNMEDAGVEPTVMPLHLLRKITNGFAENRMLGSGSFGTVYEGVYPDGKKIAVKMLKEMHAIDDKQFQDEFEIMTSVRHQNIVRLVGYCHDIQEVPVLYNGKLVLANKISRALCMEYMPNGSLDMFLSDKCDKYDWHTCYRIINGICRGLNYLHNELKPPIYHLDLKPANVLLDENMVPRIADFGVSRLFGDGQTQVTKSVLGTLGYSPPEFLRSRLISNKFDIFGLGVVIIKMMAGRAGYFKSSETAPKKFTNLVQENWTNRILEPWYQRNAYSEQVKECIEIGLSCVQEDRHKRPTIHNIVRRLKETENNCTNAAGKEWLSISKVRTANY